MKKFILTAIAIYVAGTASAESHPDWMKTLGDNIYIHQLSIPGTHDSATGNGTILDSFAKTQDLTLAEQFEAGVRAFDIRPSVSNGELKIYHGIIATKVTFDEALSTFTTLLDENPSEFIIAVMRHEDDHENANEKAQWNSLVLETLSNEKFANRFINFTSTLTVGEARGKILLLSRDAYASKPIGGFITNWTHSTNFIEQGRAKISGSGRGIATLHVQDFYETSNAMDTKLSSIRTLLDHSITLNSTTTNNWVINHTSGYYTSSSFATSNAYKTNAVSTNIEVVNYLAEEKHAGPTGIIVMDFAGVDKSGDYEVNGAKLVEAVINNNSRYNMRSKSAGVSLVENDADNSLIIGNNGEISANGQISVYTISGSLYTTGNQHVSISTPGIYIVHTSKTTARVVVR